MPLDLLSLKKSIISLEKALNFSEKIEKEGINNKDEYEVVVVGVIQNFEFTYELCWKYMKRWIEENISRDIVNGVPRNELFRRAAENKLIDDVEKWFTFHRARNKTSHIYDENIANEIYLVSKKFLLEAKLFYKRIEEKMIEVKKEELDFIVNTISKYINDCEIRAFGSRVKGNAKKYSDIDLALYAKEKIDWEIIEKIKEEFYESALPYRVDIIDWNNIDENFRKIIEEKYEVINP